jgi:hypothetical protein
LGLLVLLADSPINRWPISKLLLICLPHALGEIAMVLIGKKDRLTIVASYVTWREKAEIVMSAVAT